MNYPLPYFCNCVNWPKEYVDCDGGLCNMIDGGQEITRKTFLSHVSDMDMRDLETHLGYVNRAERKGLKMVKDWAVKYYRGWFMGKRVYWFTHSACEHVFHNGIAFK